MQNNIVMAPEKYNQASRENVTNTKGEQQTSQTNILFPQILHPIFSGFQRFI